MTEIDLESIYDQLLDKFKHHPLSDIDAPAAIRFLRSLGLKQDNVTILEGYNESDRIKGAYNALEASRTSELRIRKRDAQDLTQGKASKLLRHPPSDSGKDQDQGGV